MSIMGFFSSAALSGEGTSDVCQWPCKTQINHRGGNRFDLTCIGLGPNLPKTFPSSILITCLSSLWGHSSAPPTVDAAATADPMASHGPEASHAMGSAMSSGGDRGWASHGRVNGKTDSGRYFSGIYIIWYDLFVGFSIFVNVGKGWWGVGSRVGKGSLCCTVWVFPC